MFSNSVNRQCLKWIQDNISTTSDVTCGLQLKDCIHGFLSETRSSTGTGIEPNTFAKILHHHFHGQFKKRRLGSKRITHYVGLKFLHKPSKSKEISDITIKQCTDVEDIPTPCKSFNADCRESVSSESSSQAHLPPFVDASTDCEQTSSEQGHGTSTSGINILDDNTCLSNEKVFIYEVGMAKGKAAALQKFILSKGGANVMFLDTNTTCIAFDRKGILASLTPQIDFDKLRNSGKQLFDTSLLDISILSNSGPPRPAESKLPNPQTRTLKSPFVKVEDLSGKYRPLYKEFTNREWSTCTSLSFLHGNDKNPNRSTCKKTGNTVTRKCPSYCECCNEQYYDLTFHLNSEKHRAFVNNQDNYKTLDEHINEKPLSAWLSSLCQQGSPQAVE
ncbi:protein DBF4 homolog A-like [Branchiostoma floridae]|uniref:Protein DBF4 homolog A-like n=1 Tax=Branchiostoma floridae TaxID=7739 RepID=A0A9J7LRP3_BRAFL|nr:protein DBF4 homolog A-like [Branchiostoma floridae]